MHIMIFGATGKLGRELVQRLDRHPHRVTPMTRAEVDFVRPLSIAKWIYAQKPDVVINAAAMNGMEKVSEDPHVAYLINAAAPAVMARECAQIGALFIHYSTDYVFQGTLSPEWPLQEWQETNPNGLYGWSKLAGEQAVERCGDMYFIFRLSNLYGRKFQGPLDPIAQAANGAGTPEKPVKIIRQYCSPTSARLVADATAHVIEVPHPKWRDVVGVYHVATQPGVWRENFILGALEMVFGHTDRKWSMEEAKLPLPRPLYSVLSGAKFQRTFGYELPTWRDDFAATLPLMECPEA